MSFSRPVAPHSGNNLLDWLAFGERVVVVVVVVVAV